MGIKMPLLPYSQKALEPFISEQTLQYHYGKHHKAYVDKTNSLVEGKDLDKASLKEIVQNSSGALFNASAQAWNHEFYWNGLCAPRQSSSQQSLPQELKTALEKQFGSFDEFKSLFAKEALAHFGSGWAWLVQDQKEQLKVLSTHDADTPLAHGEKPLLTCDVWEHAYYLDYKNNRGQYLEGFWNLVNWEFVQKNLFS